MGSDGFPRHLDRFKVWTAGSVGNRRCNRIGQPTLFKQQKRTTSRYHRKGGKSSYLVKPSFPAYMEAEKNIKETEAMKAMYQNRDSAEVIGKILKCRYSIVQPHSGVQQKKTGSFLLSPNMERCIGASGWRWKSRTPRRDTKYSQYIHSKSSLLKIASL